MKYRLIAIDLDGTLLDPRGQISKENLHAIERARRAGALIVPCTGRSWAESQSPIRQLKAAGHYEHDIGIFVGGAIVTRLSDGATLNASDMSVDLAAQLVEHLYDQPDAVLVFRDANRVSHDYLVTGNGKLTANSRWWFEHTDVRVHYQRPVTPDWLTHTLRVGLVTTARRMTSISQSLAEQFAGRITSQSFAGVQQPNDPDNMHVLEIFNQGVDKWRGVQWVAKHHGIEHDEIAAIGDEINDVALLSNVGLGIAMGNAVPQTAAVAKRFTLPNTHSGVAHAINSLVDGEWSTTRKNPFLAKKSPQP